VRWAFWKPKNPENCSKVKRKTLEWVDALIFAVIAASFIRIFFFEAFTIPTSSMEKTLQVGDYLFVSKTAYGPRVPMTPISFPFVHHTLPFTESTPSYVTWIQNEYRRMTGWGDIKRDDMVVFNYPTGDTVVLQINKDAVDETYPERRCGQVGRKGTQRELIAHGTVCREFKGLHRSLWH
jgi:signal peptidase I